MKDPRGTVDLVGHAILLSWNLNPKSLSPVNNIVILAVSQEGCWAEESAAAIGEWRARFRSVCIQWSLSFDGLHVAVENMQIQS